MPALTSLDSGGCKVKDAALQHLSELKTL